jgi:hypothetical protein
MGSPRVDVVFRLWQCDKENHGWREGPPVTVLCQSFRSAGRAFTLRQSQFRTKKEYTFASLAARASLRTLAGKCGGSGSHLSKGRFPSARAIDSLWNSAWVCRARNARRGKPF